jgi:hypothetical protein
MWRGQCTIFKCQHHVNPIARQSIIVAVLQEDMALRLPKARVSPAAIVPSIKDLHADIRNTIAQMQAMVEELLQLL